jgi:hypothetical protein
LLRGHRPAVSEALAKLEQLRQHGPNAAAFSFRTSFPPPDGDAADAGRAGGALSGDIKAPARASLSRARCTLRPEITRTMDERFHLRAIALFTRLVETGGFSPAAASLGQAHSRGRDRRPRAA